MIPLLNAIEVPQTTLFWLLENSTEPMAIIYDGGEVRVANHEMRHRFGDITDWGQMVGLSDTMRRELHKRVTASGEAAIDHVFAGTPWHWSIKGLDDRHWLVVARPTVASPLEDPRRLRDWLDRQDVFVSVADRHGHIIFANQSFLNAHGLTLDDLVGHVFVAEMPDESTEQFIALATSASPTAPSYSVETPVRLVNGETRWQAWTVQVLYDEYGQMDGFLSVGRDITTLHTVEQEREQLLQELNNFAHTVAHDLKHPIHTILGYLELLKGDDNLTSDQHSLITKAQNIGHQMNAIIKGLLRLGDLREKSVEFQPLDLSALVDTALQRMVALIEERGATITVVEGKWPSPLGYRAWVEEAIANYISNAIKYGGKPPIVRIYAEQVGDAAYFCVEDNGAGVNEADRKQLFYRPVIREDEPDSNGMGLPIVRRVIERHGGTVGWRKGSVLGGSCFYFSLPL